MCPQLSMSSFTIKFEWKNSPLAFITSPAGFSFFLTVGAGIEAIVLKNIHKVTFSRGIKYATEQQSSDLNFVASNGYLHSYRKDGRKELRPEFTLNPICLLLADPHEDESVKWSQVYTFV